ncbi:COPII coat Sec23p-Sfb3p heterodimer component [Coemansia sp. RSA 1822]|nr:COPII coat Sec23p-Sfb3p heterodimer component [Coemansia sp. RSA 638]KAJ2567943.1 COPII coat Sec23p-Sfb3p heterodimer component [Coemansia sp. RSA 1822]
MGAQRPPPPPPGASRPPMAGGQRPPPPPPAGSQQPVGSLPPAQGWSQALAGTSGAQHPGFPPQGVSPQYRPMPQQQQFQQPGAHGQMPARPLQQQPMPQQQPMAQQQPHSMPMPQQQQQQPQQFQQQPQFQQGMAYGSPSQQQQPPPQRPMYAPSPAQQPAQHLQQPQPQQHNGVADLTQQMGGMTMDQQHKQRTRRVYPTASSPGTSGPPAVSGYPPVSNMQTPGYPGTCVPGYPSPAGAPITGPQTFVPGAQAPAPMPNTGAAYARSPSGGPLPPPGVGQPQAQPAPYEPPKPRIDPSQMPTPVTVHAIDQELHDEQPYSTALKTNVPLASTNFTAIDDGNSNPRFVRLTMYSIPHTEELLKASHMPLGIIVQPLADLAPTEAPVKLIDFGDEGPIRCSRCKTYINPYMVFINGGKHFVCNICRHENDVADDYFCNLDMVGRRLDREARPELHNGSVDFVATKDFVTRDPQPATFVFAIDVTWNAVQSSMVAQAAAAIKDTLYGGPGLPLGAKVAIITYDRSAHFYSLSPSLDQAQMMVVPDINDMFVPINEGFAVDPLESRHVIEGLLDSLPSMFAQNRTAEPVFGAVVQAVHEALRGRGGKLFAFQTALPTFGPGSLKQRDDPKLHNTDKERTLYEPQDSFYRDWAIKLVEEGICCSLYTFPSAFMDLATLSQLSTLTGGELYSYPGFDGARDGKRFGADLRADVERTFGANAVLRIRTSDGLRVDEHFGNLYMRNHVDVELAGVTSDTAIGALLQYDGRLDEKQDVYFQIALLYTTSDGQRRIRVHNLAVPCTTLVGGMFRNAEMNTSMNLIAKVAASEALTTPLKSIRDKLSDRCVQILTSYRRNCASGSSPGQLILPEAYKLSPLYMLSLLKSPAIRGGADVPIDQRIFHMNLLRQFSVRKTMDYFYPTIVPVHALSEQQGELNESTGLVTLPTLVRASYTTLDPAGAYLVTGDGSLTLWLGRQVPAQLLQEALGVPALEQVDIKQHALPELNTPLNRKIGAIARQLVPARAGFASWQIIRQGMDQAEVQFATKLIEDRNSDNMTYVDYVCAVHRQIQVEVRPKGPTEPKWSYN